MTADRAAHARTQWDRYALAVVSSLVAITLAGAARQLVTPHYFFILLTAVVFSAWYGGRGPGLLTTALSAILAVVVFARYEGSVFPPGEIGIFALAGTVASELFEAERRSRRRAERLSAERDAILRQMADGVILADTEGRILFANDSARALHRDAMPGETVESIIDAGQLRNADGDPLPAEQFPLLRALRDDVAVRDVVWRIPRASGADRVVQGSAAPVRVADMRYGAVLLLRDVSEMRHMAAERDLLLIKRDSAANRAAFFAEASAMLASSLNLEITLANIARLSVAQLADWCAVDLFEPDGTVRRITVTHRDAERADEAATLRANAPGPGNPYSLELRVLSHGEPILLQGIDDQVLRLSAVNDQHLAVLRSLDLGSLLCVPLSSRGRVLGAITMAQTKGSRSFGSDDMEMVTELANRAASAVENAQLYEAALAGSKAKSDFLAVMSHELRTPLNAIIGYAELLRAGIPEPLPEPLRPYVERTLSASRHLLQLISEVLTFSRIEAGRVSVQLENVELSILMREVRLMLEPLAADKQLRFEVRWPPEPIPMRTDSRKVKQILVNLAANAIKFTEQGSVEVVTWVEGRDVFFEISDTGIGIDPDHLEHIFEPFWQVEQRTTRRTGGTGLGLTIVQRLTTLLDGDVHIHSVPGEGSTFTVRVPQRLERRRQPDAGAGAEVLPASGGDDRATEA